MSYEYREIFTYECTDCHKKRQTLDKKIADKGICRPCRQPKIIKGQLLMFIEESSSI